MRANWLRSLRPSALPADDTPLGRGKAFERVYYVAHLSQRDPVDQPGAGDPYAQDLERREFVREVAVRLMILWRAGNHQPAVTADQAAQCWADAEALWNARPWED